jgi:hypothetical protein
MLSNRDALRPNDSIICSTDTADTTDIHQTRRMTASCLLEIPFRRTQRRTEHIMLCWRHHVTVRNAPEIPIHTEVSVLRNTLPKHEHVVA